MLTIFLRSCGECLMFTRIFSGELWKPPFTCQRWLLTLRSNQNVTKTFQKLPISWRISRSHQNLKKTLEKVPRGWCMFKPRVNLKKALERLQKAFILGGCTGIVSLRLLLVKPSPDKPNETLNPATDFNWRILFDLIKPHLLYLLVAVLSALATAFLNIQIPLDLGRLVNVFQNLVKTGDDMSSIYHGAYRLVCLYVLQASFTFTYISAMACVAERVAAKLRKDLFSSLTKQEVAFFDERRTGEILNRLTADVQEFKSGFKQCVSQGLRSATQIVGCGVSLYVISPEMTRVIIVLIPSIVGVGYLLGKGLRALSQSAQAQVALATEIAEETLGNIRTVRAFAMEDRELFCYSQELEKSRSLNERLGFGIGIFQGLSNLALNSLVLVTLCLGGLKVSSGELSGGDLMAFLVATQTIQKSLAQGSLLFGHLMRGMTAGSRVFDYLERTPSMALKGGKIIPYHSLIGNIEFKGVKFSYPTRSDQVILDDFNLKIPHGKVVALVGPSGNGKSTVAALIERFYEVDEGEITLDGVNIKHLDPSWLRGRVIGYINQEPVLFADTVMENIRYGCPDATDQQVIEAAKKANADSFIRDFPQGYNTIVGERGITVSGGQKQRISIARALLKDPHILLLDEATSALDSASEREVQLALETAMQGRTTLVIAHRLCTIKNADSIAVVMKGKVLELGTHESLKRQKRVYWNLIQQQDQNEQESSSRWF